MRVESARNAPKTITRRKLLSSALHIASATAAAFGIPGISLASKSIPAPLPSALIARPPSEVPAKWQEALKGNAVNAANSFRPLSHNDLNTPRGPMMGQADVDYMRSKNVQIVRLAVSPQWIGGAHAPDSTLSERMNKVHGSIELFAGADIKTVVSLHEANPERMGDLKNWDNYVRFAGAFAKNMADAHSPDTMALELFNEPAESVMWPHFQQRLLKVGRRSAPYHTLVLKGGDWATPDGLQKLRPLPDPNVFYGVSFYTPYPFTHAGAEWGSSEVKNMAQVLSGSDMDRLPFPVKDEVYNGRNATIEKYFREKWSSKMVQDEIGKVANYGLKNDVTVWLCEYGAHASELTKKQSRQEWGEAVSSGLDMHKLGGAVWALDDMEGKDFM